MEKLELQLEGDEIIARKDLHKDELSSSASSCTYASSSLTTSSCLQTYFDADENLRSSKFNSENAANNDFHSLPQDGHKNATTIDDLDVQMEREKTGIEIQDSNESAETKTAEQVIKEIADMEIFLDQEII